jgi:hypothetical protein
MAADLDMWTTVFLVAKPCELVRRYQSFWKNILRPLRLPECRTWARRHLLITLKWCVCACVCVCVCMCVCVSVLKLRLNCKQSAGWEIVHYDLGLQEVKKQTWEVILISSSRVIKMETTETGCNKTRRGTKNKETSEWVGNDVHAEVKHNLLESRPVQYATPRNITVFEVRHAWLHQP